MGIELAGSSMSTDLVSMPIQMQEVAKLTASARNPATDRPILSFAVRERRETTVRLHNRLRQQVASVYKGSP